MKKIFFAILFISISSFAETGTYTIKGMHCDACSAMISKKVCALENIETCDVQLGKMTLTSKPGTKLDQQKIESAVSAAGEKYKIIKAEVK